MKSLKITAKEMKAKEKSLGEVAVPVDKERYPWGTRIDLDNDTLEKLGIDELPAVGSKMTMEAKVTVIGSRQSASTGSGESRSLELQITDMELGDDGDEVDEGELTRGESKAMSAVAKKIRSL